MKKRLISLMVAVVMLFSMLCPAAYADDETKSFDACSHDWVTPIRSGYSVSIPGTDYSISVKTEQCSKCKWYKHIATLIFAEFTYYSPLNVDVNGLIPTELTTYWLNVWYNTFGKNATATKFTPGGGSTSGGGVGRPKGYADDNGTPNYSSNGNLQVAVYPYQLDFYHDDVHYAYAKNFGTFDCPVNTRLVGDGVFFDVNGYNITANTAKADSSYDLRIKATYLLTAPVSGIYNISTKQMYGKNLMDTYYNFANAYVDANYKTFTLSAGESISFDLVNHIAAINNLCPFTTSYYPIIFDVIPSTVTVHKQSNVNIYNNTWNGNIYVDNSNNLTYIYPQYTTINEKNETVTNISNTPIIYNNETYQYYTYDQTTKNYYYITYPNQPTPPPTATPSPSPAPTETPSPSPSPAPVEPILPANRFRIIPNMTGNNFTDSHGTWSAFGSSEYSSLYTYFRAFTVDSSYWWTSSQSKKSGSYDREMPCWLAIEIPDPENYYIDGYVLKGAGYGIYYDDWHFQYSDDGSAWIDLDSVSDGGLKDQKEHDFNVTAHKAHKYYRWYFTKAPVQFPGLGTANLYGYNAKDVVTPTPSPSPAPDTDKPGGDTTGILAVLVEIRDNMIQGFLDIKAAFVAGFAELSANFTLAIENLNVNIQNVFNKKFPDQSTPETALPSPTPSPSPAPTDPPSPSPAPDPGKPDSGDKTNNFWTIIFPNGGGTEDGKKGIFWALVSLILALIAFFANLAVGVGYLFPFLPDGVVMTINTCLIVIFLFTIIKFIMRSK